ncbi:GTPase [Bacillus cereus group sp. MYBK14-1]|uniref:GTPase n=1 Tax=Bacillus cereus group sp. MYBK14-1 TaxID=3450682 RepID=UPI003F79458C
MEQVKYVEYVKEIENIKEDFNEIVSGINNKKCITLMKDYMNDSVENSGKDSLEIAFIGQYSAGKSTMITALTENMDIKIGQNVTTDKVTEYKWNNVVLIDTPGIGTDQKEHTDLAFRHMDLADLLVYVVTTQGFDDLIARDFKRIAFQHNKSPKIMVVVNKTSLESIDNKMNWENDIKKVISPLTLEDFRVTFIDAKSYLDALKQPKDRLKNALMIRSNLSGFISHINDFIKEKGIVGRLVSDLNIIGTYLDGILNEISTDEDRKKIQELLVRKKFLVVENRKNINKKIEREVQNLYTGIMNVANELISILTGDVKSDEINYEFENIKDKVEILCSDTGEKIEEIVDQELDSLIKQINALENTLIYKELLNDFSKEIDFNVNLKDKQDLEKLKKAPDVLKDVGKFLGIAGNGFKNWCVNAESVGKGLKAFSGSDAHKFILDVGRFFGKKFKPYEALKIVDKLGKAGEVLSKVGSKVGVVAGIASPLIAAFEEYQEGTNEKRLIEARTETRNNFRAWAKEIQNNTLNKKEELLKKIHDKELENINIRINSLRNEEMIQSEQSKSLLELQSRIDSITKRINENL